MATELILGIVQLLALSALLIVSLLERRDLKRLLRRLGGD